MKKIVAGILALTACCVFTSCDLLPSSSGTGTNNNGGGLGNLGGGNGGETTIISEKVANETAWRNAFNVDYNHFTIQAQEHYIGEENWGDWIKIDNGFEWNTIVKGNKAEKLARAYGTDGGSYCEEMEKQYYIQLDGVIYQKTSSYYRESEVANYEEEIGEWAEYTLYKDYAELKEELFIEFAMIELSTYSQMFNQFSYDEEEQVYLYSCNIDLLKECEQQESLLWEDCESLVCKIWIQNGVIVKWQTEAVEKWQNDWTRNATSTLVCTYQFGVGEPNLPEFVMPE